MQKAALRLKSRLPVARRREKGEPFGATSVHVAAIPLVFKIETIATVSVRMQDSTIHLQVRTHRQVPDFRGHLRANAARRVDH
jgi:hypothetical protein